MRLDFIFACLYDLETGIYLNGEDEEIKGVLEAIGIDCSFEN